MLRAAQRRPAVMLIVPDTAAVVVQPRAGVPGEDARLGG
jgi:hypothetical protein